MQQASTDPKPYLHVALKVEDVDRSRRFYEALFDQPADKVRDRFARFTVSEPPLVLSLNQRKRPRRDSRVSHLGIRLGSQAALEAARERLGRAGLIEREERNIHCCHAIEDKFWARDPDGNEWELYELVDDLQDADGTPAAPAEESPRCCD